MELQNHGTVAGCGNIPYMTPVLQINELAEALSKAQGEFPVIPCTSENPYFKSRYADLHIILKSVTPALFKNGLSVVQLTSPSNEYANIRTILMHKSGQSISSDISIKPEKNTPQAMGSAFTYGRRYALAAILCIAADTDDDGNEANDNKQPQKPEWGKKTETKTNTPTHAELQQKIEADKKKQEEIAKKIEATEKVEKVFGSAEPVAPERPEAKPLEQNAKTVLTNRIAGAKKNGYTKHIEKVIQDFEKETAGRSIDTFSEGEALQLLAVINKTKWKKDSEWKE